MQQTKRMICVVCPLGCEGELHIDGENKVKASGFRCPRGEQYALEELTSPRRILTTSVRVRNGDRKLLPVVSAGPVPRDKLKTCTKRLMELEVEAPVAEGQVICRDILATGIDMVAARDIKAQQIS